jgi:hypothetical protein
MEGRPVIELLPQRPESATAEEDSILQVAVSPEMPILLANPMNQALLVSWLRSQAHRSIFTETD